jgi:hypothetical protein
MRAAAAQSDTLHNGQFRQGWTPPRPNRRGHRRYPVTYLENLGSGSSTTHTLAVAAARSALTRARQQVANLDRFAGHLPIIGMRAAAERLAHRAAGLRELIR